MWISWGKSGRGEASRPEVFQGLSLRIDIAFEAAVDENDVGTAWAILQAGKFKCTVEQVDPRSSFNTRYATDTAKNQQQADSQVI